MSISTHLNAFAAPVIRGEGAIVRCASVLVEAYRTMRGRARAMSELSRMSDAELADIGLVRGDLDNLFRRGH